MRKFSRLSSVALLSGIQGPSPRTAIRAFSISRLYMVQQNGSNPISSGSNCSESQKSSTPHSKSERPSVVGEKTGNGGTTIGSVVTHVIAATAFINALNQLLYTVSCVAVLIVAWKTYSWWLAKHEAIAVVVQDKKEEAKQTILLTQEKVSDAIERGTIVLDRAKDFTHSTRVEAVQKLGSATEKWKAAAVGLRNVPLANSNKE